MIYDPVTDFHRAITVARQWQHTAAETRDERDYRVAATCTHVAYERLCKINLESLSSAERMALRREEALVQTEAIVEQSRAAIDASLALLDRVSGRRDDPPVAEETEPEAAAPPPPADAQAVPTSQ